MAAIELGSDWSAQLQAYVERLQTDAVAAAQRASEFLHEVTVDRARQSPVWNGIADAIEVWSEDGYLVVGVRDSEFASQAFTLEYGDEVRPPNPFFRVLDQDLRRSGEVMRTHMESMYGPGQMT